MLCNVKLQHRFARAEATEIQPLPSDPPAAFLAKTVPATAVRDETDRVLHIFEYETTRRDISARIRTGNVSKAQIAYQLDELHVMSLKPAVLLIEPLSSVMIGKMKRWTMSADSRPARMRHLPDHVLLEFVASELVALDQRLVDEMEVDERFATFLARDNQVKKSMTASQSLANGRGNTPAPVPAQTRQECPKCHFSHHLRECRAQCATMSKNGPPNLKWVEKGQGRPWQREQDDKGPGGGRGGGYPQTGRPMILPP